MAGKSTKDCNCEYWPWPKHCDPICTAKLLGQVSAVKISNVLKLPQPLSRKVHAFAHSEEPASLVEFRARFTPIEIKKIQKSVRGIDAGKARRLGLGISPKYSRLKE